MKDVSVIIVNWNTCEDLRICLSSIYQPPIPTISYDVWVVDNASTDQSVMMVQTQFPQVRLIANSENLLFTRANNQAIAQSDSRYVFLLNSDASLHPGTLDNLIDFADQMPQAGIVGPKVFNPDGTLQFSCRRFPSILAGFFRNTYLGRLFPKNRYAREYLMADVDHARISSPGWVSGCAMLIRRAMINEIGPLDENLHMYCEDVDICKRCWDFGLKVFYLPTATVTHAIGRSSDKNAERMIVEFHRSWFTYYNKHYPNAGPLRRGAVYCGLQLRAGMRIARRRINDWLLARKRQRKNPS